MAAQTNVNPFWREMQFGAAFMVAPVVWGVMAWMVYPEFQASRVLPEPGLFMMLAVGYPVLEEIVFRGGGAGAFAQKLMGNASHGAIDRSQYTNQPYFYGASFYFPPTACRDDGACTIAGVWLFP